MTLRLLGRILATSAALGTAALFLPLPGSNGYSTLGGSLGLAQRDVRVFDNFTDASANNNVTPDANWPGYTGAELALWKGCAEWGSVLHGTGSGDPHQPGGLGSGGANFDVYWMGNATAVGGANDNIISEVTGSNGGVLAYCETPISDGWRIRFYQDPWVWQDGPGASIGGGNNFDLQGIVCHEYGHALGLGHSDDPIATMEGGVAAGEVSNRSIESDDVAGLQSIYGAASVGKPRITSLSLNGSLLTLNGTDFGATNDEVWFTQSGPNSNGAYLKVLGVSSSGGGTQIQVTLPSTVGPGDVLVKNGGSSAHSALSNAFPFDAPPQCLPPATYCTAKVNSQGCTPTIGFTGNPSASDPTPFTVQADLVVDTQLGLLFYGFAPVAAPFQGGIKCVASPTKRTPLQDSGGNFPCAGNYAYDFNARIQSGADPALVVGANVYAQWWYRDGGDPAGFGTGLTDALSFTVCD